MRVSIWQQFSSNHSSSFTVVGRFDTSEAALTAALELQGIVRRIHKWYSRPENEEMREFAAEGFQPPSPIETEFAQQYDVQLDEAIDWIANAVHVRGVVKAFGNWVFLTNRGGDANSGEQPFDTVIAKLGGEVFIDASAGQMILVSLTSDAPNESTSQTIFETVQHYLNSDGIGNVPWIGYYKRGKRHPKTDELQRLVRIFVARQEAEKQWNKENVELILEMNQKSLEAFQQGDQKRGNALRNELDELREHVVGQAGTISQLDSFWVLDAHNSTSARTYNEEAGIKRDGLQLTFYDINFLGIVTGLPALIAWLKEQGCSNIQFTVKQS